MFQLYLSVLLLFIKIVDCASEVNDVFYENYLSRDLPHKSDLETYAKSLRRIVEFSAENKHDLDLNFAFGLFLVNVNLKHVLLTKGIKLPKQVTLYLTSLLEENDDLVQFFNFMVDQNKEPRERLNKMIISLFTNERKWIRRLKAFDTNLIDPLYFETPAQLANGGITLDMYMNYVDDIEKWTPEPRLSDLCMAYLAGNQDSDSLYHRRCKVSHAPCYEMLLNGTNFGYALSHRLLFLINARNGRGCSMYSEKHDRQLTESFCTIAYEESKFIAANDYKIIDLFLEFISLCAVDGFAQFLRRDWLHNSLRFQTHYGCFGMNLPNVTMMKLSRLPRAPKSWKLSKQMDHQIMGGLCNGHVTSVAAAALSSAIRYILETHY